MYALVAAERRRRPARRCLPTPARRRGAGRRAGDPRRAEAAAYLFVIALVGTTVAPWQFFFHQSNVVDKRITSRWLRYERLDTLSERSSSPSARSPCS